MSSVNERSKVSRRSFVAGGAVGTAAAFAGFGLRNAAWARAGAPLPSTIARQQTADTKPYESLLPTLPRGGVAIYAFTGAEPAHLDAQLSRGGRILITSDTMNDWLVRYDLDGNLVPSLASSYEQVDDLTLKFTLRTGVKFHNGREMTSEDVKRSVDRARGEESVSVYKSEMSVIADIQTPAPDQVVFITSSPAPGFIHNLTRIAIVPMEVVDEQGDMKLNPVGAGPFKLKEWKSGEALEVERFADYWDPEAPRLDGIIFRFIPDERSTLASLEAGEIHTFRGFGIPSFESMMDREDEGIHVKAYPALDYGYLMFNTVREPFTNASVRKAISMALDRAMFNEVAHNNISALSWFPVPLDSPLYPKDLESERDVEGAKALLAEAGFPDGFKSTVLVSSFPLEQPYGIILQSQLAEIGVQLEIIEMELGEFLTKIFTDKDFDMTMLSDAASPDPSTFMNAYLMSTGGANGGSYNNPELDALLVAASSTFDETVRAENYRKVFELLVEEAPLPIILQYSLPIAWRDPLLGEYILSTPENFRNNWPAVAMNPA